MAAALDRSHKEALPAANSAAGWAGTAGGAGRGGHVEARGAGTCGRSVPFTSLQYFSDSAEAVSWLLLRQKQLESASCGKDQTDAEALLQSHQRLEQGMRAFEVELRELEDQARAAAALVSLTVRWGTWKGARLMPPTLNVRSPQSIGAIRSSPKEAQLRAGLAYPQPPPLLSSPVIWNSVCVNQARPLSAAA